MLPNWWSLWVLWLAQASAMLTIPFTVDENNTYTTQLSVGYPPQIVNVNLDFASADLTLLEAPQCYDGSCGSYYNLSVTETAIGTQYFLDTTVPADGSALSGFYIEDSVTIGGQTQNDTVILIRNSSSISQRDNSVGFSSFEGPNSYNNVWGLGPRGSQAGVLWMENDGTPGPLYQGLLQSLPNISESFSIWVDPATSKYGSLTLGGLDQSLFAPHSLVTVPITNLENDNWLDYTNNTVSADPVYLSVDVTELQLSTTNETAGRSSTLQLNETAILDSRFGLAMPPYMLQYINSQVGGIYNATYSAFLVPCDSNVYVNVIIHDCYPVTILISEFISKTPLTDNMGNDLCTLDIDFADQIYFSNRLMRKHFIAVNYVTNHISFGSPETSSGANHQYVPMNATYPFAGGKISSAI